MVELRAPRARLTVSATPENEGPHRRLVCGRINPSLTEALRAPAAEACAFRGKRSYVPSMPSFNTSQETEEVLFTLLLKII